MQKHEQPMEPTDAPLGYNRTEVPSHMGPGGVSVKKDLKYELDTTHVTPEDIHLAGVKRIEAISSQLGKWERFGTFFAIFLLSYALSMDGSLRYQIQTFATASFSQHSLLSTLSVLSGIIGAAGQPVAAKLADAVGRVELLIFGIGLYAIGTIVECTSKNISHYAGGVVIYQIGLTTTNILLYVIISDMSSLRSRLFFSFIPPSGYLINSWISGNITPHFTSGNWRWGIGMFALIVPVASILVLVMLFLAQHRASRNGALAHYASPFQQMGWRLIPHLFWQLDIVGALLTIAWITLIFLPLTLAGGVHSKWREARTIAPLVVGFCLIPVWIVWERTCRYPLVPFRLLKDRGVWAGLAVTALLYCGWSVQGGYLYAVLYVSFNQSYASASRIGNIYSFTSTLTGIILGLVVMRVRRLKGFIIFGCCLYTVAFGLLIRFRGGVSAQVSGVIGAEVCLGLGAGMFSYPTMASVQARTKHEHVAVVTGLYLATFNLGGALGSVISGAIWTQRMPIELEHRISNATIAASAYGDPYTAAMTYPVGTPERQGMIEAYRAVQRLLGIIGICLCVPLVVFSLLLRNTPLGKAQSAENAEEDEMIEPNASLWERLWR